MNPVNQQKFAFNAKELYDLLTTNPPISDNDILLVTTEIIYRGCVPVVFVYAELENQELTTDRANGCPHPCPGVAGITGCAEEALNFINSDNN